MSEMQGCTLGGVGGSVGRGRQRNGLAKASKPFPRDAGSPSPSLLPSPGFIDPGDHAQLNSVGRSVETDCRGWKRSLPRPSYRRCSDGEERRLVAKNGSRCEQAYSRELTGSLEPALAVAEREEGPH